MCSLSLSGLKSRTLCQEFVADILQRTGTGFVVSRHRAKGYVDALEGLGNFAFSLI